MAIDVWSEISSPGISPRISFSYNLNQTSDAASVERRLDLSLSNSDFDFCIESANVVQELSSADELFSNGEILPMEVKKSKEITPYPPDHSPPPLIPTAETPTEKKRLKEFLSGNPDKDERRRPPPSKSLWQFKRSTSLKCDNKSPIPPLTSLSRSNSTGSVPNPKQTTASKDSQRQQFQRQKSVAARRRPSVSSSGTFYSYNSKKNSGSYNGNAIKISPVLNLPPPDACIGTVTNLFGLGSLFVCRGKKKKKEKKKRI